MSSLLFIIPKLDTKGDVAVQNRSMIAGYSKTFSSQQKGGWSISQIFCIKTPNKVDNEEKDQNKEVGTSVKGAKS